MTNAQLAKITRPRTAPLLPRPRLFQRLDLAAAKPLTWICAQVGAGKTSLVVSYLAARPSRPLWYQVDRGDADAASFFYFLGVAAPKHRQPMPLLTFELRPNLAEFTRVFFRTLFGRLRLPFILVLDDYQEVAAASDFHDIIPLAITELPRHGRVICISRNEPPASFAKLGAEQAIELVDDAELRFTEAETTLLANQLTQDKLPKAKTEKIHKAAAGWAAGIVLAVKESSHRCAEAATRAETTQLRFDYFAKELFSRTDTATQQVLYQTAFLPRLTVEMAEQLTGDPQAALVLANLQRQNLFTTKSTAGTVTYQFHRLFRKFLLAQAEQRYSVEKRDAIRRKAAQLLEASGQLEAAADHYRQLRELPELAGLVCRHAQTLLSQGRQQTLQRWLTAIPEPLYDTLPWLRFWRAQAYLGTRHAENFQDLQQCFKDFRTACDHTGVLMAWAALVMFICRSARFALLDPWLAIIDHLLAEAGGFPSAQVETEVAMVMMIGIEMRQPDHPTALAWAQRTRQLCRGHLGSLPCAVGACHALLFHIRRGEIESAREIAGEFYATRKRADIAPLVRLTIQEYLSSYEFLLSLPKHRATIAEALELNKLTGTSAQTEFTLCDLAIQAALHDGTITSARQWLSESQSKLSKLTPPQRFAHCCNAIRWSLVAGDVQNAMTYVPEMSNLAEASGAPAHLATSYLLAAQVQFHSGARNAAQESLTHAIAIARSTASPYFEFPCRWLEAQFALCANKDDEGLAALRRCFELGAKHRFMSLLVWLPEPLTDLCVRALRANIEADYARDLVRRHRLLPDESAIDLEAWPWPVRIYTLGQFKILKNDIPLTLNHTAQRRALALLKAILAHGGKNVDEKLLLDLLWPGVDAALARVGLNRAMHRLRKLLGGEETITRADNQLGINRRTCWVDAFAAEQPLKNGAVDAAPRNREHATELCADSV